ncbi:MAG: hypothetical protein ABT940_00495 [Alphaproteobacteria bacterium]
MTDDTLRKECERLYDDVLPAYYEDDVRERSITALLAFARAQQAKGLGEAAGIARDRATRSRGNGELRQVYFLRKDEAEWIASKLDAQATAREQGV